MPTARSGKRGHSHMRGFPEPRSLRSQTSSFQPHVFCEGWYLVLFRACARVRAANEGCHDSVAILTFLRRARRRDGKARHGDHGGEIV